MREFILIIVGFVLLIKGADLLVKAATSISRRFGLSEMLIGLTIVAVGTSLPEIVITISSAVDSHDDLIIRKCSTEAVYVIYWLLLELQV